MSTQAFICDAIRTPFGRYGGALSSVRTDDLGAIPLKALMARNPKVDWAAITDVLSQYAPAPVRIDAGRLTFLDSSGIRGLLACRRIAEQAGSPLSIPRASPNVFQVLQIAGLLTVERDDRCADVGLVGEQPIQRCLQPVLIVEEGVHSGIGPLHVLGPELAHGVVQPDLGCDVRGSLRHGGGGRWGCGGGGGRWCGDGRRCLRRAGASLLGGIACAGSQEQHPCDQGSEEPMVVFRHGSPFSRLPTRVVGLISKIEVIAL